MVLPQSGNPISLLNLQLEYDDTAPTSLNEFYGQAQAPASGTIDLADFYTPSSTAAVTNNLLFELDARNNTSWSGSGTTWYDTTSNNYDFTLVNGPTGGTDSVVFDGSNDYAEIADGTWIPDGTSPQSLEFYAKINSIAGHNLSMLMSKTAPSSRAQWMGLYQDGSTYYFRAGGPGAGGNFELSYTLGTNSSTVFGSYHHYVYTYDGSVAKLYYDGTLVDTSSSGVYFGTNTAPFRLMCFDPSNSSYSDEVDGEIRVCRLYSDALSASEVTTNRDNCTGGATATDSVLTVTPLSHSGTTFTATFTFNQNVGLFDTNDITVTGGSKGTFTAVSKKVYTLVITPSGNSDLTISVPANASINAANLDNNAISETIPYSTFTTNNLVCKLDATDSSSYGGSGSTWSDISSSGTTYNATLYNSPTYTSTIGYFTFNGSNTYSEVDRPVQDDFSLGVWFRTTVNSGSAGQWYNGKGILDGEVGGSTTDFGISMGAGKIMFGTGSNDTTLISSSTLNDGDWHYIVATRTKSTGAMQLYVDGSLDVSNSSTSNTSSLTAPSKLHMGRMQTGGDYWQGDISQVHIYSDVLTSTEVSTNFTDGVGTYYTPVITASGSHSGSAFTFTINFSTEVNGFTASDITVTNASKGSLSGSGKTYTIALTPTGNNDIAFSIGANAVSSVTGSVGNPAFSTTISYVTLGRTSGTGTLFQGASSTGATASGWTNVQNGNVDDGNVEVPLGFTWTINNTGYTSVFVGSNNYITFGSGKNDYDEYNFASWSIPKILMTQTSDNSYQYVTYKQFGGYTRIRFEGNASTGGTVGSGNIVWECTFFSSSLISNQTVEVRCGSNGRGTSFTMGIGGPSSAYDSHSSLVNDSVVYEGNSTGTSFTAYTSQYIQGYNG